EGAQARVPGERNPQSRVRAPLGHLESRSLEAVVRLRVVVPAQPDVSAATDVARRSALLWVLLATALGAAFRFYGLGWGAPYFHFHIDEHIVFTYADALARDSKEAANSAKFFMYSPFPMYVLNAIVAVYTALSHPLDLAVPRDEVTYMLLGRAISASLGAATVPLTYPPTRLVPGHPAGSFTAFLIAGAV